MDDPHSEIAAGGPRRPEPATAKLELALFVLCAVAVIYFLFLHFGRIPSGLYHDQTAMGYDGRCLDKTLADKNGTFLPLFFFTFYDWLSPIPIYSMALTEALFGATPFGVDLPSALCALGMAAGLFFLLRRLTGNAVLARWLALLSLLVPSIFLFARYGFEASYLPCYLVLALNAFLRFEDRPSWRRAAWAGAAIGFCTYTYPTGRLVAPLIVIAAATSFYFHLPTRKHLWAFLSAAACLGLPMGIYMLMHPDRLLTRVTQSPAWAGNPGVAVVIWRMVHTYYQHFAQTDFLFRTGQHIVWHNAGEGLLPVWIAGPYFLGWVVLWLRRKSPFARILAATLLISPLPVMVTLQPDFPHTGRTLQFVPLVIILAGLGISELMRRVELPRWVAAAAVAIALFEGAQDLSIYFTDYAQAQERSMDDDVGAALRIAFDQRKPDEPMYLPEDFFYPMGSKIEFWGDLDPKRRLAVGLDGMGFHKEADGEKSPGLVILPGDRAAPRGATAVGATPADSKGPPRWRVYRVSDAS